MFHTFGWNQVCEQCFASSISCHQYRHLMASDCVSRELSWGSKEPIVDANDRDLFSVIGPNHPTMRIAFASASHTVRTPGSEGDVTHRMSLHPLQGWADWEIWSVSLPSLLLPQPAAVPPARPQRSVRHPTPLVGLQRGPFVQWVAGGTNRNGSVPQLQRGRSWNSSPPSLL